MKPHPGEADFTLSCCLIIYPFFSQTGPTEIQDLIVQIVIVISLSYYLELALSKNYVNYYRIIIHYFLYIITINTFEKHFHLSNIAVGQGGANFDYLT